MKILRRIFFILTLLCCVAALGFGGTAIWMQIQVSGENLLTMNSHWGYILAVNSRWVTLTAVILGIVSVGMLVVCVVYKWKHRKKKAAVPVTDTAPYIKN